jgi:hypothetical protein
VGGPCENEQWPVARTPVVLVREGQFLRPIRRVFGVIEVEDNGGRGRGVARTEVGNKRLREPIQVGAVSTMLTP